MLNKRKEFHILNKANIKVYYLILFCFSGILGVILFCFIRTTKIIDESFIKRPAKMYLYNMNTHIDKHWSGDSIISQKSVTIEFRSDIIKKRILWKIK